MLIDMGLTCVEISSDLKCIRIGCRNENRTMIISFLPNASVSLSKLNSSTASARVHRILMRACDRYQYEIGEQSNSNHCKKCWPNKMQCDWILKWEWEWQRNSISSHISHISITINGWNRSSEKHFTANTQQWVNQELVTFNPFDPSFHQFHSDKQLDFHLSKCGRHYYFVHWVSK